MRNDEKKRALVGNANNKPSEDFVTKIQKHLCVKPRLASPSAILDFPHFFAINIDLKSLKLANGEVW